MGIAWKSLGLIVALAVVGVGADAFLKMAGLQAKPFWNRWFLLGLTCSMGFAVIWLLLVQTMKLATAGVVYAVTSTLLLVCVGVVFFGERLSGAESTGVVMAVLAVALLGRLAA